MGFWYQFWPAFAATAAGVTLGIPVALYIQSLFGLRAKNDQAVDKLNQTIQVLTVVGAAVDDNRETLVSLRSVVGQGVIPIGSGLEWDRFEMMKSSLQVSVTDLMLKADLAQWFHFLKNIDRLIEQFWTLQMWHPSLIDDLDGATKGLQQEIMESCRGALEGHYWADLAERVTSATNDARKLLPRFQER